MSFLLIWKGHVISTTVITKANRRTWQLSRYGTGFSSYSPFRPCLCEPHAQTPKLVGGFVKVSVRFVSLSWKLAIRLLKEKFLSLVYLIYFIFYRIFIYRTFDGFFTFSLKSRSQETVMYPQMPQSRYIKLGTHVQISYRNRHTHN